MIDASLVHLIAAARPNFMKVAPLYHALKDEPWCDVRIVHTGQHYDANMSDAFFRDLSLPEPAHHLEVGSGSHAEQTANVMMAYERVCLEQRPDWVVVVGDVNSTAACAMVCAKLWIPVVHLEAGLRSRDRRMPEEINRLVTDAIADVLWTPSMDAGDNLLAEGVSAARIECIGNIMIDSYEMLRPAIEKDQTRVRLGLDYRDFGVVTLHRPSNVDDRAVLGGLVERLIDASTLLPMVFPIHPRTRRKLQEFGLESRLQDARNVILTEPLSYISFMNLVSSARLVVTDSGGVQEETTYLGVPCLTLRESTERPITVSVGTNRLVKPQDLRSAIESVLNHAWAVDARRPALWDGQTARRAAASLERLCRRTQTLRMTA